MWLKGTILGDILPKTKHMGCRSVIRYIDAVYFSLCVVLGKEENTHTDNVVQNS